MMEYVAPRPAESAVDGSVVRRYDRYIGSILIASGRLSAGDAERVLQFQKERNLPFGEAALQLGLITPGDLELALAKQFDYSYLRPGESGVSEEVVAAYSPFTPQVEAFRALRGQLMMRWFDADANHKTLAIVSAERSEGRSYLAANLAVVFSQLGQRTLLIDADLRNSRQHQLFDLDNRLGLTAVLSGRGGLESIQRIPALKDLFVLPAGSKPPNPAELLSRPAFGTLLEELALEFDVIFLDTPAASEAVDAQTLSVRARAALVVVRRNRSRAWRVRGIADHALHTSTSIVGSVLNDF